MKFSGICYSITISTVKGSKVNCPVLRTSKSPKHIRVDAAEHTSTISTIQVLVSAQLYLTLKKLMLQRDWLRCAGSLAVQQRCTYSWHEHFHVIQKPSSCDLWIICDCTGSQRWAGHTFHEGVRKRMNPLLTIAGKNFSRRKKNNCRQVCESGLATCCHAPLNAVGLELSLIVLFH